MGPTRSVGRIIGLFQWHPPCPQGEHDKYNLLYIIVVHAASPFPPYKNGWPTPSRTEPSPSVDAFLGDFWGACASGRVRNRVGQPHGLSPNPLYIVLPRAPRRVLAGKCGFLSNFARPFGLIELT